MKQVTCRRILIPVTAGIIFLCLLFLLPAFASEEISYSVSFVDANDYSTKIFNTQSGSAEEGTLVSVSFPETILGSDGHVWRSIQESPMEFEVLQSGNHKYYIEFQQGEETEKPADSDTGKKEKLEQWYQTAWAADCTLTGQNPEEQPSPDLTVTGNTENNSRIKNLVSMIDDADWHYFYMIGKNYVPQTLLIGTEFDAAYSAVTEEEITLKTDRFYVIKVRVQRKWKPETCYHRWILTSPLELSGNNQPAGVMVYKCEKCGVEEQVHIPDPEETRYWREGDTQIRKLGSKNYRFVCVDEDYSGMGADHKKTALFLCDSVIRSEVDSDDMYLKKYVFGADNNYKTSDIRSWLTEKAKDSPANTETIYTGVNTAYTGTTAEKTFEQLSDSQLTGHEIGFQLIQDQLFCLSLEEALKYREVLWRFNGSAENNPESQLSPYSAGYYLRTPFYAADDNGIFKYSRKIYVVDLEKGNIHTAETGSDNYGIRPAFVLAQE